MKNWGSLLILAVAQFVMVLDTTVMNVSITEVANDVGGTITDLQTAITLYTLVMAAFMLAGARLGDMFGRGQVFAVGLAIYGLGSFLTGLSHSVSMLLCAWSVIEGIGAIMVMPSIAALVVTNFEGQTRAFAYAVLGGVAAAGAAVGPLIGGWVTANLTWRYVFFAEVILVIGVLLARGRLTSGPLPERRPTFDVMGLVLSASGLGIAVLAVLKSGTWGWFEARAVPTIGGHELTVFGFSPVIPLICAGLVILWGFVAYENRRKRSGRDVLLDPALLDIAPLRAGLMTFGAQQMTIMGCFFVLPVYLQTVLGYDAFETGLRLLPISIAMLIAALCGPRIALRRSVRGTVWIGLTLMTIGSILLVGAADVELNGLLFGTGLAFFGAGAGLLASQTGNIVMSSAPPAQSSEAGGLQGTAMNLGSSLGTAFVGAVLLAALSVTFVNNIQASESVPEPARTQLATRVENDGVPLVTGANVESALIDAGADEQTASAVADTYVTSQVEALKRALAAVVIIALFGFWLSRKVPAHIEPAQSTTPTVT